MDVEGEFSLHLISIGAERGGQSGNLIFLLSFASDKIGKSRYSLTAQVLISIRCNKDSKCVYLCVCVSLCVCVREKEREREREMGKTQQFLQYPVAAEAVIKGFLKFKTSI